MFKEFGKLSLSKKLVAVLIIVALIWLIVVGAQSTFDNLQTKNNYYSQKILQKMNVNKDQAIFIAIQENNLNYVKKALKMNKNIEVKNSLGETPLLVACQKNNLDIIKFLVEKGANIKAVDNRGNSVLHKALGFWFTLHPQNSKLSIIQYLVDNGADVNVKNNIGNSPILEAVNTNSTEIMDYLISKGANIKDKNKAGDNVLILAVSNTRITPEMIKYYTSKGISINAANNKGETPLTYAIRRSNQMPNFSLINVLAENGSNINTKDKQGKTILMYAAEVQPRTSPIAEWKQTNPSSVDSLTKKLPVNATDNIGKTALMYAAEANNCANVMSLIKAGANVNQKDKSGKTAIIYAAGNDTTDVLTNHGANINAQDNNGKTALMYAKDYSSTETLITNQANYKIKDKQGKTAADYARANAKLNIATLLQSPNPYQNLSTQQIHCNSNDEVHFIGVAYSNKDYPNKVDMKVSIKNKPIILLLFSYKPMKWEILSGKNSKIKKVILAGSPKQTCKGLSYNTPIVKNTNDRLGLDAPTSNRNEYSKLMSTIEREIGVRPKTSLRVYAGKTVEVNGENTIQIYESQDSLSNLPTRLECRDTCLLSGDHLTIKQGPAITTRSKYKGKWYLEATLKTSAFNLDYYDAYVGIDERKKDGSFSQFFDYSLPHIKENKLKNGDIIGVAMDLDNSKLYFYVNGEPKSRFNSIQIKPAMEYWVGIYTKNKNNSWSANFGAQPFKYPVPSGFKAFNAK